MEPGVQHAPISSINRKLLRSCFGKQSEKSFKIFRMLLLYGIWLRGQRRIGGEKSLLTIYTTIDTFRDTEMNFLTISFDLLFSFDLLALYSI
jgi:hypothetical protein